MTAAQLRNVTVKHDLHPDAPVYVETALGLPIEAVASYHVLTGPNGRNCLLLILRDDREPRQELPADDQPGDNARLDAGTRETPPAG